MARVLERGCEYSIPADRGLCTPPRFCPIELVLDLLESREEEGEIMGVFVVVVVVVVVEEEEEVGAAVAGDAAL